MAQQVKSTHRGHCQICGRLQAVQAPKGLLAKHGYTVKGWGYFMGTCQGSDKLPLQVERKHTDSTCAAVAAHAERMDKLAEQYRTGAKLPEQAKTGKRVLDQKLGYHVDEYGPFGEQNQYHQEQAVAREVAHCEMEARHACGYVRDMQKLAAEVHGTELLPIIKLVAVPVVNPTVDVKKGTVTGVYKTKAARQADLDRLSRQYETARKVLQDLYLRSGDDIRKDKKATELYYGVYSLAHWRTKHSELALKLYGDAARAAVEQIEALVKAREAVKNA